MILVEARGHRLECPEAVPGFVSEEVMKVAEMLQDTIRVEEIYGLLMWLENAVWYEGFKEGMDAGEATKQAAMEERLEILVDPRLPEGRWSTTGSESVSGKSVRPPNQGAASPLLHSAPGGAMGGVHAGSKDNPSCEPGHAEEDS
jgi:hypothetical protein